MSNFYFYFFGKYNAYVHIAHHNLTVLLTHVQGIAIESFRRLSSRNYPAEMSLLNNDNKQANRRKMPQNPFHIVAYKICCSNSRAFSSLDMLQNLEFDNAKLQC